jgi:uncharacterized protein YecA (UPF0149 family)
MPRPRRRPPGRDHDPCGEGNLKWPQASASAMGFLDRLRRDQAQPPSKPRLRPNDPCPCGSGKPVKECCAGLLVDA